MAISTAISRKAAGLGLLAYGLGTPVAFALIGTPGGDYDSGGVAAYVSAGHATTAFVLAYVGAFAALGLLPAGRWLAERVGGAATGAGAAVRTLTGAAVGVAVTGWFLVGGVAVAAAEGGAPVRAVAHPVLYLVCEISNLVAVCAPAFVVGIGALVLAVRGDLAVPLRVLAVVAAICGITAPAYYTAAVFWLWVIGSAVTLLVRRAPARQPSPAELQPA